jgi:N-acetylglucosaminyl-diphospho-decaprenol L-rhamnosyltransferase
MITIAAVVLHFRTPAFSLDCLNSLHLAGVPRVVLVDNSQDDGVSLRDMTEEILQLRNRGLQIDIEQPGWNLGFAAGVNLGITRARANGAARILLLNSDAKIDAASLSALSAALDEGYALVAPRVGSNQESSNCNHAYHRWSGLLVKPDYPGSFRFLSGACLLISERIVALKLFDEAFFFYGEDVELSARLIRMGMRITCVPKAFAYHVASSSAKNGSWFYEYSIVRGHWLLAHRLTQSHTALALAVIGRMIYLPLRACMRSIRGRSLRPLRAFFVASWDVLLGINRDVTPLVNPVCKS